MVEISEKNVTFAAIGICAFGLVVTLMTGNWTGSLPIIGAILTLLLMLVGLVSAGLSYGLFQFGHLIMPMVTKRLGVRESMGNDYFIPPSQDAVIRQVGGAYQATSYIALRIYEAATAGVEEETTVQYMDLWERSIVSFRFPVKVAFITYLEDMAKYRENIETERYKATIKLGKEREKPNPDALTIDKWEREIARLNDKLSKLTSGEKPLGVVMYAATSAMGVNEASALAAARKQTEEMRSAVGNALNFETTLLTGEDLKKCFRWEHFIPPEPSKFLAEI